MVLEVEPKLISLRQGIQVTFGQFVDVVKTKSAKGSHPWREASATCDASWKNTVGRQCLGSKVSGQDAQGIDRSGGVFGGRAPR